MHYEKIDDCYSKLTEKRGKNITMSFFLFYLFSALIILSYVFLNNDITSILILSVSILMLILYKRKGIYYWVGISYILYVLNTLLFAISVIAVFLFLLNERKSYSRKDILFLLPLVYAFILIAISYRFGYDSQFISAALTFANITIFLLLIMNIKDENDIHYMTDAYFISAFIFTGVTILSLLKNGGGLFDSNRLQFEDNVRDMANGIVVAVFIWIISLINKKKYGNMSRRMQNIIGALSTLLLILTLSKGAIFALGLGFFIYVIAAKKINFSFISIVALILGVILVLQVSGLMDFSRFLERNNDLNGRTDIWLFYYNKVVSRGLKGFLFGVGPGNINRIAVGEYLGKYYAHSVILDFFFAYGIVGLVSFLTMLLMVLVYAIKQKNNLGIGLFFLICASYFVTGASTNTQIFLVLYYIICFSKVSKNNILRS